MESLSEFPVYAVLPAADFERAKAWYRDKLGLTPSHEEGPNAWFRSADGRWFILTSSQYAGTSNYRTLDELHARLDPAVFWRVHRSHLVNINKIKEIVPWFSRNYILRMKDEKATEIPVSRTQTRRLREYLKI